MSRLGILALVGAAGALLPLQIQLNGRLAVSLGGALWAGGVSALLSAVVLLGGAALWGEKGWPTWPPLHGVSGVLTWSGGVFGAIYLVVTTATISRMGGSAVVATVILGQTMAALVLDQSGLFSASVPLTPAKLVGAALVVAGAWLVNGLGTPA